jgi:hypothetical protein
MAAQSLAFSESRHSEVISQLDGIAAGLELERYPRVLGFWSRWRILHRRFLRMLAAFPPERAHLEAYVQAEIDKFVRLRSRILSSTVQFFQHEERSHSHEARIFARLLECSDTILMQALNDEVSRLRGIFRESMQRNRVIGAYSRV